MTTPRRSALRASCLGLGLTLIAAFLPHLDRVTTHVLAAHIHTSYPTYTEEQVDTAVNAWLMLLSVIGALGVLGWIDQFLRPNPGHGLSGLDETGSEGVGRRRSLATVSAVCAVVSAGYVVVSADCGGVFGVSGCRRRFRASNTHREAAPRTERAHLASA